MTHLESILARKALVAVGAGKRLDREVNSLVSLQVVISIETLRTLIAFERSIMRGGLFVMPLQLFP